MVRPEPQCFWSPRDPAAFDAADAVFDPTDEDETGRWRFAGHPIDSFPLAWRDVRFTSRFTPFRHLAFFPEQAANWEWLDGRIRSLNRPRILNLFGYLDFTVPGFLGIGVLAILLGITMWLQFKLQPAQMDPVQQQVFAIMPWMMMFIMAPFAAGLLIYWITSNLLTIGQQKYLYSKHPQLKAQADKDAEDAKRAQAKA